jgi:carboxylate-amine ligase
VRIDFAGSPGPTLGVEWELACVDAGTGELVPVAPEVLAAVCPPGESSHPKVKGELLVNTVEAVTGICRTVAEAADDLTGTLGALRAVTDPLGIELFSAGCHPFAHGEDQEVSEGERYATLIDRTRWWGRQMVIFGVHVPRRRGLGGQGHADRHLAAHLVPAPAGAVGVLAVLGGQ